MDLIQKSIDEIKREGNFECFKLGEMTEWSNVPDSKSGEVERSPGVRIPLSPPLKFNANPR